MYKHILVITKRVRHNGKPIYDILDIKTGQYLGKTYCNVMGVFYFIPDNCSISPFQLVDICTLVVNLCDATNRPTLSLDEQQDQYEY